MIFLCCREKDSLSSKKHIVFINYIDTAYYIVCDLMFQTLFLRCSAKAICRPAEINACVWLLLVRYNIYERELKTRNVHTCIVTVTTEADMAYITIRMQDLNLSWVHVILVH